MPSHIFIRLGLWDEAIQSNLDAKESAICYAEQAGFEGHWDEELHTIDYAVYGYLQKGDDQKALEQKDYLYQIHKITPVNFKVSYALASVPSRIALEKRDWQTAAHLQHSPIDIQWQQFPWQKAILHFTRALGAAQLKDTAHARNEIDTLESLHQQLVDKNLAYEANQVLIQQKTAQAWLLHAQGNKEEAIELMREAADMEDGTEKHPVTPCEVLPARELLGDLYLAQNKSQDALEAYQKDLEVHPNRLNGLYGAALASQKLGKSAEAKMYFDKIKVLTDGVESPRMVEMLGVRSKK
jgi:tetratricopeptide (TPR) repeat protein